MKAPICEICLKNDILCAGCEAKLKEGKITPADVEVSRKLVKLEEKIPALKDVVIKRVIEARDFYILVVRKEDVGKVIGKKGTTIKKISKELGKNVKVIEENKDVEKTVERLIKPATIKGINILYTKEGEVYRVRVAANLQNNLEIPKNVIESAATLITSKKVEIVFE